MRFSVSDTAEYGDYVSGPRIIDDRVRETMRAVLGDIQDGSFANRWIAENDSGRQEFERLRAADRDHQIEKVGAELRAQMAFLNPVVVVAGQAQAGRGHGRRGRRAQVMTAAVAPGFRPDLRHDAPRRRAGARAPA
jgi:hypothetical protein